MSYGADPKFLLLAVRYAYEALTHLKLQDDPDNPETGWEVSFNEESVMLRYTCEYGLAETGVFVPDCELEGDQFLRKRIYDAATAAFRAAREANR